METSSKSFVNMTNTLRLVIFPSLLSILSILIWRGVSQLQDDVSLLLADNNMQKVQINYLEKQVENLNNRVYDILPVPSIQSKNNTDTVKKTFTSQNTNVSNYLPLAATKTEIFDINDYIKFT